MYCYSNGEKIEHTTYISKKTMLKEADGSKTVKIYEVKYIYNVETQDYDKESKFITENSLV